MPAGLPLSPEPSVTLDIAPTDPGEATLAGGDDITRLAGERSASCSEDLARLCPCGTDMGFVEPLRVSDEMDMEGERPGACDSGGDDGLVPGERSKSLDAIRLVTAAERAPGGSVAEGPRAYLRVALKPDTRSESAGEGFGVEMDAVELGVSAKGRGGVCDDLIRSAANRTLVGTRLRRIADGAADDGSVNVPSLPPGDSLHGEGSGFRGEIMDADVESDGAAPAKLRASGSDGGGILRKSIDDGRRNSEARRGRVDLEGISTCE